MTSGLRRTTAVGALMLLAACGGGQEEATSVAAAGPPDAQTATVVGAPPNVYQPSTVTAVPGRLTLTLNNKGGTPHNLVFADDGVQGQDIGTTSAPMSSTFTFGAPGRYVFVCTIHPGMEGAVQVG